MTLVGCILSRRVPFTSFSCPKESFMEQGKQPGVWRTSKTNKGIIWAKPSWILALFPQTTSHGSRLASMKDYGRLISAKIGQSFLQRSPEFQLQCFTSQLQCSSFAAARPYLTQFSSALWGCKFCMQGNLGEAAGRRGCTHAPSGLGMCR